MSKPRFSALPILQYCGQSQIRSAMGAGGRSAAIGTAFHAKCSNAENASALYARLSPEEKAELDALIPPTPIVVDGVELSYESAAKEVAVALLHLGEVVVSGTADMAWQSGGVAYVCDIKKTSYTAVDGPHSLQVVGYAMGYAQMTGCHSYAAGIWDATNGDYSWGETVDTFSQQAQDDFEAVVAAANNHGGEYNVGAHCNNCYARKGCPQWLMPIELAETTLAPFTSEDAINGESAARALLDAQRARDTAERVIELVKSYARGGGQVLDGEGKIYRVVDCKGRASLDSANLERDHPEIVQRYTKFGAAYQQYKWVNLEPKKRKTKKGGDA